MTSNYFIYDLLGLGSKATHALDVQLRDRECNRQDFTIPITAQGISIAEIDRLSQWKLKAWGDPYECEFA